MAWTKGVWFAVNALNLWWPILMLDHRAHSLDPSWWNPRYLLESTSVSTHSLDYPMWPASVSCVNINNMFFFNVLFRPTEFVSNAS